MCIKGFVIPSDLRLQRYNIRGPKTIPLKGIEKRWISIEKYQENQEIIIASKSFFYPFTFLLFYL